MIFGPSYHNLLAAAETYALRVQETGDTGLDASPFLDDSMNALWPEVQTNPVPVFALATEQVAQSIRRAARTLPQSNDWRIDINGDAPAGTDESEMKLLMECSIAWIEAEEKGFPTPDMPPSMAIVAILFPDIFFKMAVRGLLFAEFVKLGIIKVALSDTPSEEDN